MPVYDYVCQACGQRVEIRRSAFDEAQLPCPQCGAGGLKRLYSTFALVASATDRTRNLDWIDRDVARKFGRQVSKR